MSANVHKNGKNQPRNIVYYYLTLKRQIKRGYVMSAVNQDK